MVTGSTGSTVARPERFKTPPKTSYKRSGARREAGAADCSDGSARVALRDPKLALHPGLRVARNGTQVVLQALRQRDVQRCRLAALQDRRRLPADREVVRDLAAVLDQEPRQPSLDALHRLAARGPDLDAEVGERDAEGRLRLRHRAAAATAADGHTDSERALHARVCMSGESADEGFGALS